MGLQVECILFFCLTHEGAAMRIWIIEPKNAGITALLKDEIERLGEELGIPPPSMAPDECMRTEKRLYPRIPCFLLVDYATQDCSYRAFIRNLSADGAFIESQMPAPHGRDISLVISVIDDRRPVKIQGEIVRTHQEGFGVRFDPVAEFLPDETPG
jgi:hypothetical protein